jgi:hypothetical protein
VTYDCGLLYDTFAPEPYEICSDAYSIIEVALENARFLTSDETDYSSISLADCA